MSPQTILAEHSGESIREPRIMRTGTGIRRVGCLLCKRETTLGMWARHLLGHRLSWTYVQTGDGCWEWSGPRSPSGYGIVTHSRLEGRVVWFWAHRYSYEHLVGPIPDGYEVDHLCRNRACVRPDHLEPVTGAENRRRAVRYKVGAA